MSAPIAAAQRFFAAVKDGDREEVWHLFSDIARAFVLDRAIERGMNFDLASRIRQETATEEERDEYLQALLDGVRHDLRGVDLDRLTFSEEPNEGGGVLVTYGVEVVNAITPEGSTITAGSMVMVEEGDAWRVERLRPRPG